MIGAGSVVTRDVPSFGLVMGNPAVLKGFVCYCGRKLGNVAKKDKKKIVGECEYCRKKVEIGKK
jgi:serine acetyltransferase